jgi:PAS domain S-box-containing protein
MVIAHLGIVLALVLLSSVVFLSTARHQRSLRVSLCKRVWHPSSDFIRLVVHRGANYIERARSDPKKDGLTKIRASHNPLEFPIQRKGVHGAAWRSNKCIGDSPNLIEVVASKEKRCYTSLPVGHTAQSPVPDTRLFRDVFNASPIGIAVENFEGQPLFVNPAFCAFLGFSEEELCRKHCIDFSPIEDAEKDWALFQEMRAGSIDRYQLEKRYFRKDGSIVWGRLSLSLLKSNPSPLVIAMVEDITEKKVAEDAILASEERLRLAQQAARMGSFERSVGTGAVTWTPEMESLYGLPAGGFGGTNSAFENLIHPDDRAGIIELVDAALMTGQMTAGEWRVVWPDGSVHWIAGRWQALMDGSGKPSRVVGVNIDVTERKRAEAALLELNSTLEAQTALLQSREELLKIFVKNVPAAVAMLDREMRYLQVSDRWCSDNEVEASELLGRSRYEVGPEMPERWKEVNRRALEGETLRGEEDRWESRGITRWARWEVRPWKTPEGTVGGILILAEDITRRKQMEEALSTMSRKLIQSQEQERARIGRELHDDINQRIALLGVELEQLQNDPSDIQSRLQDLRNHMAELSNDVQSLSHELHSSKLEYLGIVSGIRSWCKEFGGRQNLVIDFKSDVSSVVPFEIGVSLFRVLQEALHNVAKHSAVKRVDVELREMFDELRLTITDLGKGFDVEVAVRGQGLGLTSMQERVRLLNGSIEIESKAMAGTRIKVRVPFRSDIEQRAAG